MSPLLIFINFLFNYDTIGLQQQQMKGYLNCLADLGRHAIGQVSELPDVNIVKQGMGWDLNTI